MWSADADVCSVLYFVSLSTPPKPFCCGLHTTMRSATSLFLVILLSSSGHAFVNHGVAFRASCRLDANTYDDWRSDAVVPTMPLDEENVRWCIQELIASDYGKQMFGIHDIPAAHQITGMLEFVELEGPQVIVHLSGQFWHRRETVLGRAAMWLHACIPEITDVNVENLEELEDSEDVLDELTGALVERIDKRAPDFNGDRQTMEYQGIDPDIRGPFPPGVGGLRPGGSMINPA